MLFNAYELEYDVDAANERAQVERGIRQTKLKQKPIDYVKK